MSILSHRNIIQFYGAVTKEPHYCLITGEKKGGITFKNGCYLLIKVRLEGMLLIRNVLFSEYADNGSLYAFLQRPENVLNFAHILQWGEEIAMGKCLFSKFIIIFTFRLYFCDMS